MKLTLWDKTQAVFWLLHMLIKNNFNMSRVAAEVEEIEKSVAQQLNEATGGYIITFDIFQTNCFWFETKELCKSPDGNGTCSKEAICPILGRLKRV